MSTDTILLAHGSGGRLSAELIQSIFIPAFGNTALNRMDDSAVVDLAPIDHLSALSGLEAGSQDPSDGKPAQSWSGRLAITTDCHVVKPLFFEGGDIGRLSVCGTVNDLAMAGARPRYLAAAFVLEEGLPVDTLRRVALSMRAAAGEAGVSIVAGDTKVVERGSADGMFITTTGVGVVPAGVDISGSHAQPGDAIILSGSIGEHGLAVLSRREGLEFGSPIASDVAPLNHLVTALLEAAPHVRSLRDPTRGGLATTLNELAAQSNVTIQVEERLVPVAPAVRAACEMLGYDPLYIANEGKLVAVLPQDEVEAALSAMRHTRYGEQASVIGSVLRQPGGRVLMKTGIGGTRVVQMLTGELLPRIC